RPTWCDINLTALENNYKAIQAHVGDTQVMPIIKADAYGHGITQVASKLEELNTPCLGVAYVEEGVTLRKAGITTPIHVLGGAVERQIPIFLEHNLIFTAPSVDKLWQINEAAEAA
ncbi:MAG TPA: alanine racemase, partial [Acidimicrobiaceae bacterium]|nr:alanine racemase [Acidimicrobiaceae bacterium]